MAGGRAMDGCSAELSLSPCEPRRGTPFGRPALASLAPSPATCALLPQIARVNAVNLERERRLKAGLPVPTSLSEDAKSGELKLPFTKISS